MTISIDRSDITAVILAGGQGQRMDGQDKGLIPLWGQPLIAHVLNVLRPQVGNIVVSANRNLKLYQKFESAVFEDAMGENWGPLAGVLTALRAVSTPYLLTAPCDAPCLPGNLVDRMRKKLESENAQLCVAHDGQRLQNTITLLPCSLADDLENYLESGQRKVETWLRRHNMVEATFSDWVDSFLNVNTAEHLNQLQAQGGCR